MVTHKFKFSIIMAIYNTEPWLREAVDSVINQDIGFEENVQLILVNDGSPDNSEAICLEYGELYPENIVYVYQENKGVYAARNAGLPYVEAELVNFMDPDDIITRNTLSEVYGFYNENVSKDLALVTVPLEFFEAKHGLHYRYPRMGNRNRVIDLNEEPNCYTLSLAASYFDSVLFQNNKLDDTLTASGDIDFILRLLYDRRKLGYVVENGVRYMYRKRNEGSSIVDQSKLKEQHVMSHARVFDKIVADIQSNGELPDFIIEAIIDQLLPRIPNIDPGIFGRDTDYKKLIDIYKRLSRLTFERLKKSPYTKKDKQKYIFASRALTELPCGINSEGYLIFKKSEVSDIRIKVQVADVSFHEEYVQIEVQHHMFGVRGTCLALKSDTGLIKPTESSTLDHPNAVTVGKSKRIISDNTVTIFRVPYGSANYKIVLTGEGVKGDVAIPNVLLHRYSHFVLNSQKVKIWYAGYEVCVTRDGISIFSNAHDYKYIKQLLVCSVLLKRYGIHALKPVVYRCLMFRSHKQYILINDRPLSAGDNGEALFRYINSNEPLLSKKTYFVIDKKSRDIDRLKQLGKVVYRNSLKHKFLFLNSQLLLSSHHDYRYMIPYENISEYKYYADLITRQFIWLQHGITKDDIRESSNRYGKSIQAVVIATEIEKKIFNLKGFYFGRDRILTTGFPRFDFLESKPQSLVTIMPTWRKWIPSDNAKDEVAYTDFNSTDYFRAYSKILGDSKLRECAERNNVKINFVPHPANAGKNISFEKHNSEYITVVDAQTVDYKKIFSESSLLITDYSSVFFDFAYLYKPTMFYQFDKDRFFAEHYKKSEFFDYEKDGTGPVYTEHNKLIDAIVGSIDNNFKLDNKYKKRINKLFIHHDRNNSKRLVDTLRDKGYID